MQMSSYWQDAWNSGGGPKYPHEKVVQFCFRNFAPECRPQTRALDMGCGSGVHTAFLAAEGFQTTGVDLSEVGVANTRRWLEQARLHAAVRVEDIAVLDFPPASFDLIICVGVLECAGLEIARKAVQRAAALLNEGGKGLFLFAGEGDFRVKPDDPQPLYGYRREEVETLFAAGFTRVWIDRYITTYQNGQIEQRDWLITVQK
jgi:SAM-dependent methyltransferase